MLEKNPPLSESLAVEEFAQALATALRRILAQEQEESPDTTNVELEVRKSKQKIRKHDDV